MSALTCTVLGRPMTGTGAELFAVEPVPRTPYWPEPQAYTLPAESKSECVRAPVANVTSVNGSSPGRSSVSPGKHRSPMALRPHPQTWPCASMANAPSKGMGFANEVIRTPVGNSTLTARVEYAGCVSVAELAVAGNAPGPHRAARGQRVAVRVGRGDLDDLTADSGNWRRSVELELADGTPVPHDAEPVDDGGCVRRDGRAPGAARAQDDCRGEQRRGSEEPRMFGEEDPHVRSIRREGPELSTQFTIR